MTTSAALEDAPPAEQEMPGVRTELARVLASATFAKASRLCSLLAYVVGHSLAQRTDELTEQQIGIHVFGRPAGFNSAEDTIVRGTARLLRQRLDTYYREEGSADPIRITVPKGSYVAHFQAVTHVEASPVTTSAVVPEAAPPLAGAGSSWPAAARLSVAALSICLLAVVAALVFRRPPPPSPLATEPEALWKTLFTPGRKTLIVPGDGSLDAFVSWEQRPVSLADYSNQSYQAESRLSRPPGGNDVPLATRSVTPMADLRLVAELVRVPEHMGQPLLEPLVEIRYARDVAVGDSHDNNLILIGSETFNPWVKLYRGSMDFYSEHDFNTGMFTILNRAPLPGEPPRYQYARDPRLAPSLAYTHVAFLDNAQGSGKVLIVEGTSMGTTYAALTFLTQQQLWQPVLDAATDRQGRLHNFEVLLGSEFVRGGLTNTHRVALHIH